MWSLTIEKLAMVLFYGPLYTPYSQWSHITERPVYLVIHVSLWSLVGQASHLIHFSVDAVGRLECLTQHVLQCNIGSDTQGLTAADRKVREDTSCSRLAASA